MQDAPPNRFVRLMPSLRQLLDIHDNLLLLDAASSRIQVGFLSRNQPARWAFSDDEAGRGLFTSVQALKLNPMSAGAFVFCEGPGSILGIRTAATAIRTWGVLRPRPVYRYQSLDWVARQLNQSEVTVIADARREHWHAQKINQPLQRLPAAELSGPLVLPERFRHWSPLPDGVRTVPYELVALCEHTDDADVFQATDEPDAFLHSEPDYKTWTPQIHRAP